MEENSGIIWKIATIVLAVLFVISLIFVVLFGVKVKNNNQVKASELKAELADQETSLKKQCQAEKEVTLNTYTATDVYGNFQFKYPTVWFTNVVEQEGGSTSFTFLGSPNLIINNTKTPPVAAIRVMYFNQDYESKVKSYGNMYKKSDGSVSGMQGTRLTGTDKYSKKNVSFILVPLRDKTIYIGTDDVDVYAAEYQKILDSFVLNK